VLLVHADGSAVAGTGDAAVLNQARPPGVGAPAMPAAIGSTATVSRFPVRQATGVAAVLVVAVVAVAEILVGIALADWWQQRLTAGQIVMVAVFAVGGGLMVFPLRRRIQVFGAWVDPQRLDVRGRSVDRWSVSWTEVDLVVAFVRHRIPNRLAVLVGDQAREIALPPVRFLHSQLTKREAADLAGELNRCARGGDILAAAPPPARSRGVVGLCLLAGLTAIVCWTMVQIQVASTANEIRARAGTEHATVVQIMTDERTYQRLVLSVPGLAPGDPVEITNRGEALHPGDTTTVLIDPAQPGVVWFDNQQRLPPGALSDDLTNLTAVLLLGLSGPALIGAAYALSRGPANPQLNE
jgi:hypothetical protein